MASISIFHLAAGFLGGVGLIIYGMSLMSSGLQRTAGDSLKRILEHLTTNRFMGALVGTIATILVQSSTATTVMTVGFVNAGLMNLKQGLSVIMGANVGTTITAQIVSLNIKALALPAIGIGAFAYVFVTKDKIRYLSQSLLGFGFLFFGLITLENTVAPLQGNEALIGFFLKFSSMPILAVLLGVIATFTLQSSAAVIILTMALASQGLIDAPTSIAMVLGDNIGTTITANIVAIGGIKSAKQVAFGHFISNVIGAAIVLILFQPFLRLVFALSPIDNIARQIANAHLIFNVLSAVLFLPLLSQLAKLCEIIFKNDSTEQAYRYTQLSDDIMARTPEVGVAQAKKEVGKMSAITLQMLSNTKHAIDTWDKTEMVRIEEYDDLADGYKTELLSFLNKTSNYDNLSSKTLTNVNNLRQAVAEMDEIADRSRKLIKVTKKLLKKERSLSTDGIQELDRMFDSVIFFATNTFNYFYTDTAQPTEELALEDNIDTMYKLFRKNHIRRLDEGLCTVEIGMAFVDILGHLEEIGDHILYIAEMNLTNTGKIGSSAANLADYNIDDLLAAEKLRKKKKKQVDLLDDDDVIISVD